MIDLYLVRSALRDLTRTRNLIAAAVLVLAPGLLIWFLRLVALNRGGQFDYAAVYSLMSEKVVFGFVMVILSLVFCTSVVAQEVENKTIVYLLTRPIPRYRIITVKFVPALLVTLVTVWTALIIAAFSAYGLSHIGSSPLKHDLLLAPIGVLAYGTVFLLLTTLLHRPLIYGLLYAFGWETWVPNMPGSFQRLSLMAYLRVLAPHSTPEAAEADITSVLTPQTQDVISSHIAWVVMITTIVVAFALALYTFSVREYVPRDAE